MLESGKCRLIFNTKHKIKIILVGEFLKPKKEQHSGIGEIILNLIHYSLCYLHLRISYAYLSKNYIPKNNQKKF